MSKQIPLIHLVLFGLLFSALKGECFADAAAQLEQAKNYRQNGYLIQAEQLCKTIATENPGTDFALQARKQLVFLYLMRGQKTLLNADADAAAALDKLRTDFSGNPGLPAALYDVAAEYERFRENEKAKAIYNSIIQNHSASTEAGKAGVNIPKNDILALIQAQRIAEAQAATENLVAQFSGDGHIVKALNDIAYQYRRFKNYPKAIELYQYVADAWPSNSDAMWAQMGVAKSNVECHNFDAAKPAIDKLLANYAGHTDLPTAIHYIARRYRKERQYDDAKALYQQIIQKYPNTSYSSDAQTEIAKIDVLSDIEAGNYSSASAAIDKMISNFSGNLNLAEMLYQLPWEYEKAGRYADAKESCQKIITNYPDSFRADKVRLDIRRYDIFVSIDAGQHDKVLSGVDKLIADFAGHSYLPEVVSQIAQHCEKKSSELQGQAATDCLNSAIVLWDKVIALFANSQFAPQACNGVADCYRKLGDYGKSNQYYQKVLGEYPDYHMAWQSQFMLGRNYEAMGEAKVISKEQSQSNAGAAYQQLLEKYPDCKAAGHAKSWLGRHSSI